METAEEKKKRHEAFMESLKPCVREKLLQMEKMQTMTKKQFEEYKKQGSVQEKNQDAGKRIYKNPFDKS